MKKRHLKSMKRWIGWMLSATVIATSGNVPAVVWAEEFSSGVDNETNLLEEREENENIISDEENRDEVFDQEIESETLFSDADTDSDGTEAEISEEDTLVFSAGQCSKSRQDAVNWAYAQDGKFLDYDKAYGTQCVDLIKYYYAYLGVANYAKGNGCDYVSNTLPGGWTRIKNTADFVPEPGDIAVWGKDLSTSGHVSIILSANVHSFVSMDQNWPKGSACKQVSHSYSKFWGVIRPDFSSDSAPTPAPESFVDVGTGFYAYLINTKTWLHATNDESGNVCVRNLKYTSDQIWYFERQSDGSYKITSCKDGRCMEVHNFESTNGTNVEMNNWNGNTAQKWFIYGGEGAYKLKAVCGNNALDMRGGPEAAQDGTNLNMWEDNGTEAQKFSIWKLDAPNLGETVATVETYGDENGNNVKISWNSCENATGYDIRIFDEREENIIQTFWNVQGTSCLAKLTSGTYHVKVYTLNSRFNIWKEGKAKEFICSNNLGTDFYAYLINTATWLHVTNDSGNVNVSSLEYTPRQIWHFELQSDCSYKITSAEDERCMEVHNFESVNGTNVEMNNWNGNTAQRWFIYGSSGAYKLKAACGNNALDMRGGTETAQNGTNINMWEDNGTEAQRFSIWNLDDIKDTIRNSAVKIEYEECFYDGREHTPKVYLEKNSAVLAENKDFKVTYKNNINAGTATVIITGIGKYTGKVEREFIIKKAAQELNIPINILQLVVGETIQIQASGQGKITYYSSDSDKAIVNEEGYVTGKSSGETAIIVTASETQNYEETVKKVNVKIVNPFTVKLLSDLSEDITIGKKIKLTASANGGSGNYAYKFLICDNKGNWFKLRDYGKDNTYIWTPGVHGKKTLYVDVKDGSGEIKRAELSCEVKDKKEALTVKLTVNPSSSVVGGKTVKLTANANGGTGSYTYKFLVCDDKGNWYKIRDFGSINTCTWTPGAAGKKTLYVDVKDSAGTVKRAALSYEVAKKVEALTAKLTADPSSSVVSAKTVKLTASANGGTGKYTYKFLICDDKGNWYKIRDFGNVNTCTWTPGAVGKKTLYVDVKDSAGTVKRAALSYEVKNKVQPLTVKFTADPSTGITSGKQVKLTAVGNGGTGSYTYKFLICDDKENWYRIRDFGSSNTCTWTPGALGKKTLYVDVKDSSGVIIRQKLDITVK